MALKSKCPALLEEENGAMMKVDDAFLFASSTHNIDDKRPKVKFDRELSKQIDCTVSLSESEYLTGPIDKLVVGFIRRKLEGRIPKGDGQKKPPAEAEKVGGPF
jgi:hypothetical protein